MIRTAAIQRHHSQFNEPSRLRHLRFIGLHGGGFHRMQVVGL
jgi:hypothetical protein